MLSPTVSHGAVQHQLDPRDELVFPQLTERGPHTDAYFEETPTGLVSAREAEAQAASGAPSSSHSTLVSYPPAPAPGGKAAPSPPGAHEDAKLVTWLPDDPHNPRNWSKSKKW